MTVASILKNKPTEVFSLTPKQTVAEAVAMLSAKKIGAAIVSDAGGSLVGILSERDVVRGLGEQGPEVLQSLVSDLMTRNVQTCSVSETSDGLMRRMTDGRFRHLPVVEDGNVIGVVSIGDIVKSRISQLESETEAMREYIAGHG